MKDKDISLPIHNKIYSLLERRTSKKILVSEFYAMVENIRINGERMQTIRNELISANLMESQVDRIIKSLLYFRYTRNESRELMRQMIDRNLISRKNYMITIKNNKNDIVKK